MPGGGRRGREVVFFARFIFSAYFVVAVVSFLLFWCVLLFEIIRQCCSYRYYCINARWMLFVGVRAQALGACCAMGIGKILRRRSWSTRRPALFRVELWTWGSSWSWGWCWTWGLKLTLGLKLGVEVDVGVEESSSKLLPENIWVLFCWPSRASISVGWWDSPIYIYISFTRSYTLRTYATRPKCLTCSKQQFPKMGVSIELSISQLRLLTFFFSPSFFSFFFPCFSLCNFLSQKCSVHTGSGRDGCEMQELYVWVCRYGLVASKTGRVGL